MDIAGAVIALRPFMAKHQLDFMVGRTKEEEGAWFTEKLIELASLVRDMPATYAQEGKGDDTIVSLHYFYGAADWYITEKDISGEFGGHHQAFGYADLGWGEGELGYISIPEVIGTSAELDLHFMPMTLGQLMRERQAKVPA